MTDGDFPTSVTDALDDDQLDALTTPIDERDATIVLHAFADYGVESEALATYTTFDGGFVVRVTHDPRDFDGNPSIPVKMDVGDLPGDLPEDAEFDLGLFHPPCTWVSTMTSINGDTDDHDDLVPMARRVARETCRDYVIENKPEAWSDDHRDRDPDVRLKGDMFGLPIAYERAFETSFPIRQRTVLYDVPTEVSPYFYADRSKRYWAGVKGYRAPYTKQHLAKNCLPADYVHELARAWLRATDETDQKPARSSHGDPEPDAIDQQTSLDAVADAGGDGDA